MFAVSLARVEARLRSFERRRLIAFIVALAIAVATARALDRARQTVDLLGPRVDAIVATRSMATGQRVGADDVRVESWPIGLRPPASAQLSEVVGHRVTATISAGQVVTAAQVAADRHGLRAGERAVTVPVPLAPPPLLVGDNVELVGAAVIDGLAQAQVLGAGRVVEISDDGITIAVATPITTRIVQHLAVGVITLIRTPVGD